MSVHTNLQDIIPTLTLVVCDTYNYAATVEIKINLVDLHEQTQIVASAACTVGSQ